DAVCPPPAPKAEPQVIIREIVPAKPKRIRQ
ncbi:TPA: outer membrane protein assembly factor BamE, partial [Neisseria gonorrhoeae]